jgi:hypothetical protein
VTGLQPIFGFPGTLADHSHRGQPPASLQPEQTSTAATTACRASERDRGVIDRLIDRLGTQPTLALADEQIAQLVSDLLWAPPLGQQPRDHVGQHRIDSDPSLARLASTGSGGLLCVVGAIPPVRIAVAADLATNRRRGSSQLRSDPANRHLRGEQVSDHDSPPL